MTKTNSSQTDSTIALLNLGQNKLCIVDRVDLPILSKFAWRAVKGRRNWYAKATIYKAGEKIEISMHRFLARTRYPLVTHHINHNSLDNRRANLLNMTKRDHDLEHKMNNIQVRHTDDPTVLFGEKLQIASNPARKNIEDRLGPPIATWPLPKHQPKIIEEKNPRHPL